VFFRRRTTVSPEGAAALVRLLERPTFELVPLRNAMDQAGWLPAGSTVSVTASPAKGMEPTIALAEALQVAGFQAVPHVAARMVRDGGHLAALLARLDAAGIRRAFVVGGDAKEAGAFPDGLSLLRAIGDLPHALDDIGVPAYPQGHAFIPDGPLLDALRAKIRFATYMTTQLCFDPESIAVWLAERRSEGIALPVHIGLPGIAEPQRLLAVASRIGVVDTHRFLVKNTRFIARLIRSGGFYRPDGLLEGVAPHLADASAGVSGVHIYTFNQVDATERWRLAFLERLGESREAA
jgi:methylenetetrahydrofolate reductase (NADPH)